MKEYQVNLCKNCRNKVLSLAKLTLGEFEELKACRCLQNRVLIKTRRYKNEP